MVFNNYHTFCLGIWSFSLKCPQTSSFRCFFPQDWGSMIGEITMGEAEFFSDLWRTSTDPNWGKDLGLDIGGFHGSM